MAKKQQQAQITFPNVGGRCSCGRCGAPCKVNPIAGSTARMMKRASVAKGLCVNCAVHDALRHLYPANLQLARSAGRTLLHPQIQRMFFELAEMVGTDARFEEIDWQAIVANWDLPFPTELKRFAQNPVTEEELAMARLEGEQRRAGTYKEPLTEAEYEVQRKEAERKFLTAARKAFGHEDPPPDHRVGS